MTEIGFDHRDNQFTYPSACVGRQIRLLHLLPGSNIDQLAYSLEELDLDGSEFRFMAISYAWGDPSDTKLSICDGRVMRITRSLYSALWQIREEGIDVYIWADAICINQMDNAEKTAQVRMMGDIYARADLVWIWLGEATKTDETALGDDTGLGLMQHVCEILEETPPPNSEPPDLLKLGFTGTPAEIWSTMIAILKRPWFYRAWVIQEYSQSKKYIFRCGAFYVPSDILLGVTRRINNYYDLRLLLSMLCGQTLEDRLLFGPFFEFVDVHPGEFSLVNLLSRASGLKSTDKRDRVFALVGLSSDVSSSLIDYDKNVGDLLRQVATNQIQKILGSADPEILYNFLCMVHESDSQGDRSSWAPSMEQLANYQSLELLFKTEKLIEPKPEVKFDGDKVLYSNKWPRLVFVANALSKLLLMKGKIIDRILSVLHSEMTSKPVLYVNKDNIIEQAEQYRIILASRQNICEQVKKRTSYPTGQDLDEVFWRSLIFDTQELGKRASPEMKQSFDAYQESLALSVVWIEHLAGKHSASSSEEVLEEIRKLLPQSKWRPSPPNETGSNSPDIWAQIRSSIKELAPLANAFPKAATLFSWDRIFFDSQLGYVGWVPRHAREGDQICAFAGSRFPFVVRPCEDGFRLIGACYMHGIMEGEAYELPSMDGDGEMMITLV